MNREKKIERLHNLGYESFKKSLFVNGEDCENWRLMKTSLQFYRQLLQIPKRTIETLEINDLVVINDEYTLKVKKITEHDIYFYPSFRLTKKILDYKTIIPHEWIDLWKELT